MSRYNNVMIVLYLCYVLVMSCNVKVCYANVTPSNVTVLLCFAIFIYVMLLLCYALLILMCNSKLRCAISCCLMLMLYYVILGYVKPCYVIL